MEVDPAREQQPCGDRQPQRHGCQPVRKQAGGAGAANSWGAVGTGRGYHQCGVFREGLKRGGHPTERVCQGSGICRLTGVRG